MQLKYTDELMNTLKKVNYEINQFPYKEGSIMEVIELEDLRKVKHGVCSDYAYTKMIVLKEKGIDDRAMAVCICNLHDVARRHAVLIVSTDQGDFILDNRFPDILGFKEASHEYVWESIPDYIKGNN